MPPKVKGLPAADKRPAALAAGSKSAAQQAPAQPAQPEVSVEERFTALEELVQKGEDVGAIIRACDDILKASPGDPDAFACKVLALVHASQFEEAIAAINAAPSGTPDLTLPKASIGAVRSISVAERDSGVMQLEAQVLYRLGQFAECIRTYESVYQKLDSSLEVKTNVLAAYVSGGRAAEVAAVMQAMKVSPRDGFELAFNAACALLDTGNFAKAEEFLLLGQRVGKEALLDEDFTEEEVDEELAPAAVQLSYIVQAAGRSAEAIDGYTAFLKKKLDDPVATAIATNNLVALRGDRDLFDALKRTEKLLDKSSPGFRLIDALENRLSAEQKGAIGVNRALLLLFSHKLEQSRSLAGALAAQFPDWDMPVLIQASVLVRENKAAKADELLASFAERHPQQSMHVQLSRAQAAASAGTLKTAVQALRSIPELHQHPAVVATLVAMNQKVADADGAAAVLDEAVAWWDNRMQDTGAANVKQKLLQETATFKLQLRQYKEAAACYKRLLDDSSSEVGRADAVTGLVYSAAHFDAASAEQYASQLPPLPKKKLDLVALEASPPTTSGKDGKEEEGRKRKGEGEPGDDKERKRKNKKKKKIRYPKNYNPENPGPPPDPERWLPRRERSTFKKKGKKHAAAALRGSQGASAAQAAAASQAAEEKAAAAAVAAAKPAAVAAAVAAKNKKKKGRR
eukprot:jgi/Chlat1/5914/Chrsp4S06247